MSENSKSASGKGVIVEFDFTALDGASILFETAKAQLAERGVALTPKLEALHLAGGSYQGAFAELYDRVGKKFDAAKSARELAEGFKAALDRKLASAVTPGFKAFVKELASRGVKVVVDTRGNTSVLAEALSGFGDSVSVFAEESTTYGSLKWDAWRRACGANGFSEAFSVAVTGSGLGVQAALVAGLAAVAVVNDHVAYQDFGGADAVVNSLDAKAAGEVLRAHHVN